MQNPAWNGRLVSVFALGALLSLGIVGCGTSETDFRNSSPARLAHAPNPDTTQTTDDAVPATSQDSVRVPEIEAIPPAAEPVWSVVSLTNPARLLQSETFMQDGEDAYVRQTIRAGETAKLDIGIIVDNSGSMEEEQQQLSTKLQALLSEVEFTDWRIAIVSTDSRDIPAKKNDWCTLIKKNEPNIDERFRQAVTLGTNGSGNEMGMRRMQDLMEYDCVPGAGKWYRPDSIIVFLVVSDEDNCSYDGRDCASDASNNSDFATQVIQGVGREPGVNSRIYGLFSNPLSPCQTAANDAKQYAAAVQATAGIHGDICASDYSPVLRQMSRDFALLATAEMDLVYEPIPETLALTIAGATVNTSNYTLNGSSLRFTGLEVMAGSKITIEYAWKLTAQTIFRLNNAAIDPKSVQVFVNDIGAGHEMWHLDSNKLIFASPPAYRDVITVNYRKPPTKARFKTKALGAIESKVAVGGKPLPANQWSLSRNGTLTLGIFPEDGELIEVHYLHAPK